MSLSAAQKLREELSIGCGAARAVRAPCGTQLHCRGWLQEAELRMLCNNLDPANAEDPDHLIVYGGTGRAARSWPCFDALVRRSTALPSSSTTCRVSSMIRARMRVALPGSLCRRSTRS